MPPESVHVVRKDSFNALQARIERLTQAKVRLIDEWSLAMKQAYRAPVPDREEALRTVGARYSDVIDVLATHIATLRTTTGDSIPRTGRPGNN